MEAVIHVGLIVTQATREERILNLLNDLNIKMNHVIKLLEEKERIKERQLTIIIFGYHPSKALKARNREKS
jgi:hypothetical protein